jgi:hypothetical protein
MDRFRIVLGIEIRENTLRIAEVEHRESGFFLSRIAERNIDSLQLDELVQKISLVVNEEAILARTASVAIDTVMTERDTIPIDADLQEDEITSFLKAEIALHNDFDSKEFKPAYEIVRTENGYNEIFYAAIEEHLLSAVKNACTRCGFDLQFIDLDHSCSELLINKLLPQMETYILVTVKDHQVEGSFLRKMNRIAYKYLQYSEEPFYFVTKIAQDLETFGKEFVSKIFVTGPKADSFLIDLLQKNADKRYELLNPKSNMLLSPVVSANTNFMEHPHMFSSVIGAALK